MIIDIDKDSGFCFGVVNAITMAEEILEKENILYCLGDIVHNGKEVKRLSAEGLKIINHDELKELNNCTVLIRAHGEPPETYKTANKNNVILADASCPVVLKLQNRIRQGYEEIIKINGQIVIFGKEGHAEVNGLVGQTLNTAIVINNINELYKIDFKRPVYLYAQTTMSKLDYSEIIDKINEDFNKKSENYIFKHFNTICGQVSNRGPELETFSKKYDVIMFVSGKKSSNGNMLFEICKTANKNSYFISEKEEINLNWFIDCKSIGICGATSTPMWLMEEIKNFITQNV